MFKMEDNYIDPRFDDETPKTDSIFKRVIKFYKGFIPFTSEWKEAGKKDKEAFKRLFKRNITPEGIPVKHEDVNWELHEALTQAYQAMHGDRNRAQLEAAATEAMKERA